MKKEKQILQGLQVSEVKVSYSQKIKPENRITVSNAQMAVEVLRQVWDESKIEMQESFKLMLLNRSNQVLGVVNISEGGITSTQVDIRIIFGIALKSLAVSIIISHSHPSGSRIFSPQDLALTEKIMEAGKLLDIAVLDHIIMTKDSYASIHEERSIETIANYKSKR
jgi:DNA repair protein RadC